MSNDCSICLSEIAVKSTGCVEMTCSHTYHLKCISKWLSNHDTCPICRHACSEMETLSVSTFAAEPVVAQASVVAQAQTQAPAVASLSVMNERVRSIMFEQLSRQPLVVLRNVPSERELADYNMRNEFNSRY